MELINLDECLRRTLPGAPPGTSINPAPYLGHPFECACGQHHSFDTALWIRELSGLRMVHRCPTTDSITCIKTTGVLRFKGFRSLFGVKGSTDKERREACLHLADQVVERCLSYWNLHFLPPNDRLMTLLLDAEHTLNEEAKTASRRFFDAQQIQTLADMAKAVWLITVETDSSVDAALLNEMRVRVFERIDQKASGAAEGQGR